MATEASASSAESRHHLDPSELGTKEYWDSLYTRELSNHATNEDDEGTIWFDESDAEAVVIRELDLLAREGWVSKRESRFLDLGTGNGHMLFALREPPDSDSDGEDDDEDDDGAGDRGEGSGVWEGEMIGVDYSAQAVDLARRIAEQRSSSFSPRLGELRFETWDFLTEPPSPSWLRDSAGKEGFDVVLDKGTFDAISLMPAPTPGEGEQRAEHPCAIYRHKVVPLIRPEGGILVITSCNWTKEELVGWLAPAGDEGGEGRLELFREAEYPTFTFGGVKGQSVVTLIFRRRGVEGR